LITVESFSVVHFVGFEVRVGVTLGFRASRSTLGYDLPPASADSGIYIDTLGWRLVGHPSELFVVDCLAPLASCNRSGKDVTIARVLRRRKILGAAWKERG
jgi:hypothetical protein